MSAKNMFGAICVAIALFFLWPGIVTSWAEMRALKVARAEREQLIMERAAILSGAASAYADYQRIVGGASGTTFSSLVPLKKDAAELVSAVGDIATTSGLQLTKIQVLESTSARATDAYATMALSIELSGRYSGLRAFLKDLEQYVRVLNVTSIEIGGSDTTDALRFSIRADTYYLK